MYINLQMIWLLVILKPFFYILLPLKYGQLIFSTQILLIYTHILFNLYYFTAPGVKISDDPETPNPQECQIGGGWGQGGYHQNVKWF